MIKTLLQAAKTLALKPVLFLPALLAVLIAIGLSIAFSPFLVDFAVNTIVLEIIPDSPLPALPFHMLALYPTQLAAMLLFAVLTGMVFIATTYWYAAYLGQGERKRSFKKACSDIISALKKIVSLIIFVLIIAGFFAALAAVFTIIAGAIPALGFALIALLAIALIYLYIKLTFVVQALAIEECTVKEALQKAWQFSTGRFWHIVLFIFIIAAISQVLSFIGDSLSEMALDETIGLAAVSIFWIIATSYAGIAMALYYLEKK